MPSSSAGPRGDPQPASGAELLCSPQGPCRSHYIIVISRARHSAWFSHEPSHPLHCDSFAPGECQLSFSGASGRWAASCPLSTPFSIHPPLEHPPPRGMRCELSVPEVGCVSHGLAPAQHPSVLSSLSHSYVCRCVCAVCMLHAHPCAPHLQKDAEGLRVSQDPALRWLGAAMSCLLGWLLGDCQHGVCSLGWSRMLVWCPSVGAGGGAWLGGGSCGWYWLGRRLCQQNRVVVVGSPASVVVPLSGPSSDCLWAWARGWARTAFAGLSLTGVFLSPVAA